MQQQFEGSPAVFFHILELLKVHKVLYFPNFSGLIFLGHLRRRMNTYEQLKTRKQIFRHYKAEIMAPLRRHYSMKVILEKGSNPTSTFKNLFSSINLTLFPPPLHILTPNHQNLRSTFLTLI